jgi:hypothetical protein
MLIDELSEAMSEAVRRTPPAIRVAPVLNRARRLRQRRRILVGSGAAIVAVVAILGVSVIRPGTAPVPTPVANPSPTAPPGATYQVGDLSRFQVSHTDAIAPAFRNQSVPADPPSGAAVLAAFAQWGPTRGSLSHDSRFLTQVRQQWSDPSGPHSIEMQNAGMAGPIRVLYAGQTKDGPAAVVAQRTTNERLGLYVGVMTTGSGHGLGLWGPNDILADAGSDGLINTGRFDLHQVSFTTAVGHDIVVLPTRPDDTVAVSFDHNLNPAGQSVRTWQALPTSGGVATAALPDPSDSWDTLVRTVTPAHLPDESPLWINYGRSPVPSNALGLWTQVGAVVGDSAVGTRENTYTPWVRRYGAADEPYGVGEWVIEGALPDHTGLLMRQVWLNGDPAHTVVLQVRKRTSSVLADVVTRPSARPLFAQDLPSVGGWLIAAGPQSTITGYRTIGTTTWLTPPRAISYWTGIRGDTPRYTKAAAFISTGQTQLQLQLVVNGKTKDVTVGH